MGHDTLVAVELETPRRTTRTGLWCPALSGAALEAWWTGLGSIAPARARVMDEWLVFPPAPKRRAWRALAERRVPGVWHVQLTLAEALAGLVAGDGRVLEHRGRVVVRAFEAEVAHADAMPTAAAWAAQYDQAVVQVDEVVVQVDEVDWDLLPVILWLPLMSGAELEVWWSGLEYAGAMDVVQGAFALSGRSAHGFPLRGQCFVLCDSYPPRPVEGAYRLEEYVPTLYCPDGREIAPVG